MRIIFSSFSVRLEHFLLQICRECFYIIFEEEIHKVIVENNLFKPGERIAVAASGGKGV